MAYLGSVVFGVAALVALVLAVHSWSGMRSAFAALVAELARRGIRHASLGPQGGPAALDSPLGGIVLERSDGVRASLSPNLAEGAATLPGFGPVHPQMTLVEMTVALPDQMICAPDRAQAAFGPFPPSPLRTGHPAFDQRFGVYVRAEDANAYRPSPPDATPWARSPAAQTIFANFDALGFVALHVHEGRGRMLFAPLAVDGMVGAMDTAALLVRPHEARPPARCSSPVRAGQAIAIVVAVLGLTPMALGLPLVSYATQAGIEIAGYSVACPNGGTFKQRFRNNPPRCIAANGTSYAADEDAYTSWRFAVVAPYTIAIIALSTALYFRRRRDVATGMTKNLTAHPGDGRS